jgi:hypothetical protein
MLYQSHFIGEYALMHKRGRPRMLLVLLLGDKRLEISGISAEYEFLEPKRFQMEISGQSPSGENSPSAPRGEEELRIVNSQLQEQADQLRALNQELVDREARLRLSVETGRVGA